MAMMMIYVAHIDACILKASWSRLPDRTTGSPWVICSHSDSLMPGDTMRGDTFVFRLSYATLASLTSTGVGIFSKHIACLSYCILSLVWEFPKSKDLQTESQRTSENLGRLSKNILDENYTHQEDIERCAVLSIHFLRTPSFPAPKVGTSTTSVEGQS